jgi:integrase/recombinase XerD
MKNELQKINSEADLTKAIQHIFNGLSQQTQHTYLTGINQFFDYTHTGINDIKNIQPQDIINFIKHLKSKYSISTVNTKLNGLKKVFKVFSTITGSKNIFDTLKKLNIKTSFKTEKTITKHKVLSKREIKTLIEHYQNAGKPEHATAVKTLYKHGLRISELLSLRIKDFKKTKDENGIYYIATITGKGSKQRVLFIDVDLYNELKTIAGTERIFNFTRNAFSMDLKRTSEKVLNHSVTAHNLRHSFATNLNNKKPEKLKAISKYLGHANTAITLNMYVHETLNRNDLKELEL